MRDNIMHHQMHTLDSPLVITFSTERPRMLVSWSFIAQNAPTESCRCTTRIPWYHQNPAYTHRILFALTAWYWTFREHEIQKGGPQIMTSWYDDVVPGMLPIFGHGSDNACSTCHMHACVNTRVVPSSAAQTWYEGEKSDVQFCLKSEISLEHRGRSRSPVSCARKAADDEDLKLGYAVPSVAIEFSPNRQCRTGLSYSRVPTPARSVTDWCVSKLFCLG